MTSRQFTRWRAFLDAEHVLDVEHEDRRFGELWALFASYIRDTKKRRQPYVWTDLFPEHRGPDKRVDPLAAARLMFDQAMAVGSYLGFAAPKAKR
jgi:hypothetical protein